MRIRPLEEEVDKEFKNLNKYQKGVYTPIVTQRPWLDEVFGGLLPNDIVTIAGASGCVDHKTEFFNGKCWKSIADYKEGEKVLQYNPDGTANLVVPSEYIKKPSTGFYPFISKYGVNQMVSEEHKMVYETDKGNINFKRAADFAEMHNKSILGFQGRFRTTFKYVPNTPLNVEENFLRLCVAIQADGHYPKHKNPHRYNPGFYVRFNLKKEHKKERLEYLLNLNKIDFKKVDTSHRKNSEGFHQYTFYFPVYIKEFPEEWYNFDEKRIGVVFNECSKWDSSIPFGNRMFKYYSNSKNNADFIQFVITTSGYRSTIKEDNHRENTNYLVGCTPRVLCSVGGNAKKDLVIIPPVENEFKYCFTVPSGMLVLRREGSINITGNSGKSFELQRVKNNIMNPAVNKDAAQFVWLDNSLEMKLISNMIRDLNGLLKKSKKKILTESFTEEEKNLVRDYSNTLSDGRFFINEEADDAITFEKGIREFLDNHKNKKAVFISIDHIALQKGANDSKKSAIDDIIESINRIKKDYKNVYFFVLSQLNREILRRIKEKDPISMPNRSDLYQSDTIYHISDYLYVTHNPNRLGITLFSKVNKEVYSYLAEHFGEVKGSKASFTTFGKIFQIILKSREAAVMFKDIYIEDIEFEGKDSFVPVETAEEGSEEIPVFDSMKEMPQNNNTLNNIAWKNHFEEDEPSGDFKPPF